MSSKNELVVKSNRLVEASYRLDLVEQRIVLLAIIRARETGRGLNSIDFVPVTAKDYAERFGVDEKNAYRQIKGGALTLYERGFVLHDTDPESGKPRTIKARWVSAASYIDGAGTIQLQFSEAVVPYITLLETEFTRYKLEKIANMSSAYAIRLYELLMQWGSIGTRETELEWLKKTLMVDKDYGRLDNFKKWVLDVAISQINAHSDLTASYTQRKTGRVVTHLIFRFAIKEEATQEKAPRKAKETHADIRESELFKRLRGHGIGDRLAVAWMLKDEARARATVEYVEARAKQGQIKGSAAGYLRTLFDDGAEVGKSAFEAGLEAQAREAADSARRIEAGKRAKAKADREATDRAKAAVQSLPPESRSALASEYRQGAGAARSASWDDKKGDFSNTLERIQFNAWLVSLFVERLSTDLPLPEKPETPQPEPVAQKSTLHDKLFGRRKTNAG